MPKVQAPPGFDCPYRHACPHLDGLSAHWVWMSYQEHPEERDRLLAANDDLHAQLQTALQKIEQVEREKAQLQVELKQLHRKQFKGNRSKGDGKLKDGAKSEDKKKKRGAPVGHPPWTRAIPKNIDRTVQVPAPRECPHCECRDLEPCPERTQHLQEDIVLCPKTQVTCFDHQQAWCPCCRRAVQQAAPGEMIGSYIGPVAKSTAAYLRHGIGLSYRNVQKIFTQLFGLSMVPASVVGFDRAATRRAEDLYADLHQKIQASAYLHADETSWRIDGKNAWLWYVGHELLAYFHIDFHRSGQAAQRVIGPSFDGVLNTDDYGAYNPISAQARQSCLAHPLRLARDELKALEDNPKATADVASRTFLEDVMTFLKECCEVGCRLRQKRQTRRQRQELKAKLTRRLNQLCRTSLSWPTAEGLRARLIKQKERLFTFVDHPQVQPTNNQAEQSLRRSVILRKLTFGNRSEAGAHSHSVLTSLLTTAVRQQRDPRRAFQELLTQPTAIAQRAFYRDATLAPAQPRRRKPKGSRRRTRPK